MKKLVLLIFFIAVSFSSMAQLRTGLLVGAGKGFLQNFEMNTANDNFKRGVRFDDKNLYNFMLGYRFRMENVGCRNLFFDVDPILRLQTYKSVDLHPQISSVPNLLSAESHNINFQFSISASANYTLFSGLYAGVGVEPTWNIVTDGKHFDAPLLGRLGYNINNKVDLSLTYRQGFTNVINDSRYKKGMTSALELSVFIPFTIK